MNERINEIVNEALNLISQASTSDDVQNIRNQFLSKKSELMSLMSTLGNLSPEERKTVGQELNLAKGKIAEALDAKQKEIAKKELDEKLKKEEIDISLPGNTYQVGGRNPFHIIID